MKKNSKNLLIGLSIYVICVIGFTILYQSIHYLNEFTAKNIIKIVIQVALIAAIVPSVLAFTMYYLFRKPMDKTSRFFLILILFIFFIFSIYTLTLVMVFYDISDSKSFFQFLLETF